MKDLSRNRDCQAVLAAINCSNFSASISGNLGTILYLNGRGWLCSKSTSHPGSRSGSPPCPTHMTSPVENFGSTGISTPFSSRGFNILNTANTLAMNDHTDVSAKCLPTQIRRPNPNAMCLASLSFSDPSPLRNRSGMNLCGLGYLDSSCVIDLVKYVIESAIEGFKGTNQRFTKIIAPENLQK